MEEVCGSQTLPSSESRNKTLLPGLRTFSLGCARSLEGQSCQCLDSRMAGAQTSGEGTAGTGRAEESKEEAESSGDACSSSPRRPGPGQMPNPWPLGSVPFHALLARLSLSAGLCKQRLWMDGRTRLLPPPCTLSIPSPEPRPGFLRKIG